ncbi:hypothetical protein [Anabaena azotica]|uniref:TolC family protein n=1 Tax=Anabaena azotica FACHB-119 TaxID=947527 RepID=A0ABR8DFL8_9NOST|nr:hypothetical protein [Anabaena azotica]MBD2505318.1 hypothetical protein [Anabaena azotica FACHB-119]
MANPTRAEAEARRQQQKKNKRNNQESQTLLNDLNNVAQESTTVQDTTNTTNTNNTVSTANTVTNTINQHSRFSTLPSNQSFSEAQAIAQKLGISLLNPGELLGTDPYKADGNIPKITAKDANEQLRALQLQSNALDVRLAKTDLQRKVIKVSDSTAKLIGDAVKYATTQIEVGQLVIENQIADVRYQTAQSKLRQTEEYLQQQNDSTQGTIQLTSALREQWTLKFEKVQADNAKLKLSIEGAKLEAEIVREQLEAKLLYQA